MKKLMTLAEALATGRPFKHKDWTFYSTALDDFRLNSNEWYATEWEIQEEEKPPMRVWTNAKCEILITSEIPTQWNDDLCWVDITETLAAALAPYIKKELGL